MRINMDFQEKRHWNWWEIAISSHSMSVTFSIGVSSLMRIQYGGRQGRSLFTKFGIETWPSMGIIWLSPLKPAYPACPSYSGMMVSYAISPAYPENTGSQKRQKRLSC